MTARIRYFTVVGDPTGLAYLEPLLVSDLGVSVAPIGPCFLVVPPWDRVAKLFAQPTAPIEEIVNVVCAHRGTYLGSKSDTYEPETAFGALYTAGCPNVAIVPDGGVGDEKALRRYDLVIVDNSVNRNALSERGVFSHVVYTENFLNKIHTLLENPTTFEGKEDERTPIEAH